MKCALDSQPTRHDPLTHYVIVRPDLDRGLLAAQVTHAAGESSPGSLPAGMYAVVLSADQQGLIDLQSRLESAGVAHTPIREADPPHNGELMAIGVAPGRRSALKRYFSSLPLLR